jgi:hypothetical protein
MGRSPRRATADECWRVETLAGREARTFLVSQFVLVLRRGCNPRLSIPRAARLRRCRSMQRSPRMAARSRVRVPFLWILFALASALAAGCDDDDDCPDGTCVCDAGDSCDFDCLAPPCTVACEGDNDACTGTCANGNCSCGDDSRCAFRCGSPPCHVECDGASSCTGACANGECRCGAGSACAFSCLASPCHVACEGQNPSCVGTCANGSCTCAAGSVCAFTCLDHNCGVTCEAGSSCTLSCPEGNPGTQGCNIDCEAGSVVSCADGSLACGRACPS